MWCSSWRDCLISSFYIKPQLSNYRIIPRHDCLISSFYIKPQPYQCHPIASHNCLISSFYIKPQHTTETPCECHDCLISSFYIKPQPSLLKKEVTLIVLYRLSTSNHNLAGITKATEELSYIAFLHQTTTIVWLMFLTYNCLISPFYIKPQLDGHNAYQMLDCLISPFYIKPQLSTRIRKNKKYCLISPFYIKPQLHKRKCSQLLIVLYRLSTSNHN